MNARIFIHPVCVPYTPMQNALLITLGAVGMGADTHLIGPPSARGTRELVRLVDGELSGRATYERCDGSRFAYDANPPKEVA